MCTCQVTWPGAAAVSLLPHSSCDRKPSPVQGQAPLVRDTAWACGRHSGQLMHGLWVAGRWQLRSHKGSRPSWCEQKASFPLARCLAHGDSHETYNNTTSSSWTGQRKEERPRAPGQMSALWFPRGPLIMLVRKQNKMQTFALICSSPLPVPDPTSLSRR